MTKAMGFAAALGVMAITGCATDEDTLTALDPTEEVASTQQALTSHRNDVLPFLDAHGNYIPENLINILGPWGTFSDTIYCEPGSYIGGFKLLVEPYGGGDWDDAAMVGVSMHCYKPNGTYVETLVHKDMEEWANWSPNSAKCSAGKFVKGARLKIEKNQGGDEDDTAANDLELACVGGGVLKQTNGGPFGAWSPYQFCPTGTVACGVAVERELYMGAGKDDTGLNSIRLRCCDAP